MRKTLLALVFMFYNIPANSMGPLERQAEQDRVCKMVGNLGLSVYKKKIETGSTLPHRFEEDNKIVEFALNYGYSEATNEEDAYMRPWARCQDYYNQKWPAM